MTLLAYGSERMHWQQSRMMNTFISLSIPAPHCQQWNTELQLVGFGAVSRTASNIIWWLNIYNIVCSVYLHSIVSDLEKKPVQLHVILIFRGITLNLSVGRKMYGSSAPFILQHTILYPTRAKQDWHLFHQVIKSDLVFLITTALRLLLSQVVYGKYHQWGHRDNGLNPISSHIHMPASPHGFTMRLQSCSPPRSGFSFVSLACAAELADPHVKFH